MALYLHCVICSRKQADGLISGMAWGRFEVPADTASGHPALNGTTFRACPTCMDRHPDWQNQALVALGLGSAPSAQPAT